MTTPIAETYNANPQREWDRLDRHRVEFGITMRALADHLPPPPARIADIGGSTGRYAIELTRRGYDVTLIDISAGCLNFAIAKADDAGVTMAGYITADARYLPDLDDATFDAVLLMGPLYHLLTQTDRLQAILEARRILRPNGLIVAAFLSRFGVLQYAATQQPDYIVADRDEMESILTTGVMARPTDWQPGSGFPDAWFAHPDQIIPLMTEGGFEQIDLLACEPLVNYMEQHISAASDDLHERWIDVLYRLSSEPSLLGASGHLLYIGCKDSP